MPTGIVIIQTPEAGAPVTQDSILSLIVSDLNEQATVMMPDLTNRLVDQAVSFLKDNGFGICFVYEDEYDLPEGIVKVQFPEKGIQAAYSEAVTLSISKYKKRYFGKLPITGLNITEKESKVKIVVQEMMNGQLINLVAKEMNEGVGRIKRSLEIDGISRGKKKVVVYVNNVEAQSYEVDFS
jgi:beta-lactam-binding protein with PASTA domain